MRINLPSGTACEIDKTVVNPKMGLVIAPDIFSLRSLYDDLVKRLATDWQMAVCAVEPFQGLELGPEIEPRFAAVSSLDDEKHLRDLHDAADALGTPEVGLLGFCMGGMYCFKSARSKRFKKIVSFYGGRITLHLHRGDRQIRRRTQPISQSHDSHCRHHRGGARGP